MNTRTLLVACTLLAAAACSSDKPKDTPPAAAPAPAVAEATPKAPAVEAAPVTLLITGDNWGEIAPCG